MTANDYICLNGEFLHGSEPRLLLTNRAFRFNDALTENIHASATEAQFLDSHIERLTDHMRMLSMHIPPFLNQSNFGRLITTLLNKNRIFGGAHIRFTVYRDSGVSYIPLNNDISYIIECSPLPTAKYELNDKGLTAGISQSFTRSADNLASLHRANQMLFMLAAMEGRSNGVDSVILLNRAGRLTETTDSNIFLTSGNSAFTPGTEQGCIPGVMRKIILNCLIKAGFRVNEQSSLSTSALMDAEEVFLTNAIEGIRWVGAYQQKRYFSKTARMLTGMLNEDAFG